MNEHLKQLQETGEIAREQGNFQTALTSFNNLVIEAVKAGDIAAAINALGHHLLVYDRLYKETGEAAFLELMFMDTQTGLRLAEKNNIHGQPLAIMQMRSAEYYLDIKDFAQAEKYYQQAFDELSSDANVTNEEKAEYLGHLAEAVIYSGDVDRAEPLFKKAHELLDEASETLRDFHSLIIRSGLFMREAYGLFLNKQTDQAKTVLEKIEPLVVELKDKHNMDGRYKQWVQLKEKIDK